MREVSSKPHRPFDQETEGIPRLIMLLFVGAFAIGAAIGYFTQGFGFFSGSAPRPSTTGSRPAVPRQPVTQTRPLPKPKPIAAPAPATPQTRVRVSTPAPAKVKSPDYAPAAPRTKVEAPAATQAVDVSGPVFRVQVGAFRSRENAETLVERLQRDGFRPYINFVSGMHRVRIGPFSNRADANQAAEELRAKEYEAFVTR